jgi:hypothetical protein
MELVLTSHAEDKFGFIKLRLPIHTPAITPATAPLLVNQEANCQRPLNLRQTHRPAALRRPFSCGACAGAARPRPIDSLSPFIRQSHRCLWTTIVHFNFPSQAAEGQCENIRHWRKWGIRSFCLVHHGHDWRGRQLSYDACFASSRRPGLDRARRPTNRERTVHNDQIGRLSRPLTNLARFLYLSIKIPILAFRYGA